MWGGASFRADANYNLLSDLLSNPYQAQNSYQYLSNGIQPDWKGEVDYEKYRYAIEGNLSLEEWNEAFSG